MAVNYKRDQIQQNEWKNWEIFEDRRSDTMPQSLGAGGEEESGGGWRNLW